VKPAVDGEETSVCSHRASRGGWGQRARKDESRNLGDPAWWWIVHQRVAGKHNRHAATLGVGGVHSSEEAANHRGAKGPY